MRCALISSRADLRRYLRGVISSLNNRIEFVDHPYSEPDSVEMAISWMPHSDAFAIYPNMQAVCAIAAGVDSILACPTLPADVKVVRVVDPGQAVMMAGFVAWHAIWHQRKFATYMQQQRDRVWRRQPQRPASDISVGILGYGTIGSCVASQLASLGFKVSAWSRTAKAYDGKTTLYSGRDGLHSMVSNTEILVNLLPLTAETRGLLNAEIFSAMKPGGYLIQTGRGEQMVEADLLAALESGHLSGASLDVFGVEPLPADHVFWHHPNIVMTPHDASDVSSEAVAKMLLATAEAIEAGSIPPNAVDRTRGY